MLLQVTDVDERLHPVEHDSEHWSDSLYFNAWDPASGVFLMTRMAVLANQQEATAGLLVWRDGALHHGYGRDHEGPAPGDWDVMEIGGLAYRMEQACRRWTVRLDDPDNDSRAHLTWDGFTRCFPYDLNPTPLPKAVAWGHYEQTCRVTGDLVVRGERIRFDGLGQRDHSWGFRDWAGLREWHWITGFLGPSFPVDDADVLSFNVFHVIQPDGPVTVNGFVHVDGADHAVVAVERETDETGTGAPQGYHLDITVEGNRVISVDGMTAGQEIPVKPHAGDTVVHEVPMSLRSGGLEGHGIYELLDNR
jgi:hypothetical protein